MSAKKIYNFFQNWGHPTLSPLFGFHTDLVVGEQVHNLQYLFYKKNSNE